MALTFFLLEGGSGYGFEGENPRTRVQFYIDAYGLADPASSPLMQRSYQIFEQVRAVADKRGCHFPELKIVNSLGDPWAVALPDGYIVLSAQAVEICYQGVQQKQGDARMAFVLGHELAHLGNNDYWHMQTFMALGDDSSARSKRLKALLVEKEVMPSTQEAQRLTAAQKKEIQADDLGFLYAAVAGYSVDTILSDNKGKNDFFTYWMTQTQTRTDHTHPLPEQRAHLLRLRLKTLEKNIPFFQYGVRLAHFGRYDDAVYFFREFQKVFPSREVFSNLACCYLQMAVNKMEPNPTFDFWLPLPLDLWTPAETLVLRSESGGDPKGAARLLKQAVEYLQAACKADSNYLPSRLNLAVAHFYRKEFYKARALIEEAVKIAPDNLEVQGFRAIIMYYEAREVDMWPHSLKIMEKLTSAPDCPFSVLFNLGRLLEKRKRTGEAQHVWKRLSGNLTALPEPYRQIVCKKVKASSFSCPPSEGKKNVALPWKLPVGIGQDLWAEKAVRELLYTWQTVAFQWQNQKLQGHIYQSPTGVSLLEFDDFAEMIVLTGDHLGTTEDLIRSLGEPKIKLNTMGGAVWSYDKKWSVLVRQGKVMEVWVSEK